MCSSKKLFYLLFLAAVGLSSCSQSDDLSAGDPQKDIVQNGEVNIVFRLQSNTATTTRSSVDDSFVYSNGTPEEYQVNSARVYLFDNPTKLFVKSFQLTELKRSDNAPNGEITYEAKRVSVPKGIYDVFVTANTDRVINKETESEFLASIDSISYIQALIEDVSKGIIMSNRASDNEATVISSDNSSDGENKVTIKLERVLARLDVAKSAEIYQLADDGGTHYANVSLEGFYIVNLPKYYYTFRHTAVLTSLEAPQWNLRTNFGDVAEVNGYVIDPYFFQKKVDASNFTNADKYYENFSVSLSGQDPDHIRWTSFNAVANDPNYKTAYCLENCTLAPAQKNGYSTGVVFRAKMEPQNNVYRLNGTTLELVTNPAEYAEVLFYYDHKFYNSAAAFSAYVSNIPEAATNPEKYQARKFEKDNTGYHCYYNYWIRHLDNHLNSLMGVMEFAVVRNNLYRMLITNVSDLGYGGDGVIPIFPDTPDEGETYLKVSLNVKPWIVRDLTNIVL